MPMKAMMEKVPGLGAASIVGAVAYALMTSGIFATKDNVASAADLLRAEAATTYVVKSDYKDDIKEIKSLLTSIRENVEQLRIEQAKVHR